MHPRVMKTNVRCDSLQDQGEAGVVTCGEGSRLSVSGGVGIFSEGASFSDPWDTGQITMGVT